jgi:hypothetical protein
VERNKKAHNITKQKINSTDDKARPILLAEYSKSISLLKGMQGATNEHGQTNLLIKLN